MPVQPLVAPQGVFDLHADGVMDWVKQFHEVFRGPFVAHLFDISFRSQRRGFLFMVGECPVTSMLFRTFCLSKYVELTIFCNDNKFAANNEDARCEMTAELRPEVDDEAGQAQALRQTLETLQHGFRAERYPSVATRIDRLDRLWNALDRFSDQLCEALNDDFGYRSSRQSYFADVATTGKSIRLTKKGVRGVWRVSAGGRQRHGRGA